MRRDFTWRDGERLVRFGRGAIDEAPALLGDGYVLVTTARALGQAPALAERASAVHAIGAGPVDELAGDLLAPLDGFGSLVVALGGGRVVDVAKALAAASTARRAAAVPTTLSAAEMTWLHDNTVCESFFATLKKELTRRRSWPTRRELKTAVFAWIEGWYNRRRLHSTLGYLSPVDYENRTLGQRDTGLGASRLAHPPIMIKETAAQTSRNASTGAGQLHPTFASAAVCAFGWRRGCAGSGLPKSEARIRRSSSGPAAADPRRSRFVVGASVHSRTGSKLAEASAVLSRRSTSGRDTSRFLAT